MKTFVILGLLLVALSSKATQPPYVELRIYDVTTNKLEGVLERFRDAVEPIRKKHGIKTLGYWTSSATNGEKFIYLMTGAGQSQFQQAEKTFSADPDFKTAYAVSNKKHGKTVDKITSMILVGELSQLDVSPSINPRAFDLRLYSVLPGKLEAFRARWRDHAVPIYKRHGLHSIGWWVAEQKDSDGHEVFVCLLAGESIAGIQSSISEFHKDIEWQRIEVESERVGKLRSGVTTYKLKPTDFSQLR